jgi:hypothetical protein
VETDGTVKVGDHGTGAFAAPQQLKGEPLDVLADICTVPWATSGPSQKGPSVNERTEPGVGRPRPLVYLAPSSL